MKFIHGAHGHGAHGHGAHGHGAHAHGGYGRGSSRVSANKKLGNNTTQIWRCEDKLQAVTAEANTVTLRTES